MPLLFDGAIEGAARRQREPLRFNGASEGGLNVEVKWHTHSVCWGCVCRMRVWLLVRLGSWGGQMISPSPGGLGSEKVLEQNLRR